MTYENQTFRRACALALVSLLLPCCAAPAREAAPVIAPVAAPPEQVTPLPPADEIRLDGTPQQGTALRGLAPAGTQCLSLDGQSVPIAPDGHFLIAFDRDAPPSAVLTDQLADGRTIIRKLAVAPGHWHLEHIDAPYLGGAKTSAEFRRRRVGELKQIVAARAMRDESDGWEQNFIWPIKARISSPFGSQRIYRGGNKGSYHSGVDLAAGKGRVYVAPADGVVVLASSKPFTLEGKLLMIDHGMGLNSVFLHSSKLLVKLGDHVKQGQPIGIIGQTGRATGPHLHWGVKWFGARIDPTTLVDMPKIAASPPSAGD